MKACEVSDYDGDLSAVLPPDLDRGGDVFELRDVVQRARALVDGPRQEAYGEPVEHLTKVAKVWSVILSHEVDAARVALCMVALKLVREANSHDADNVLDAAGYLEIVSRIAGSDPI